MAIKVLILGGGFAGLYAARELEKRYGCSKQVEISLVNRDNFFTFTPLLHEVVVGILSPVHAVVPLRRLLPATRIYKASVTGIDLANRQVHLAHVVGGGRFVLDYDHLVIALGSTTNFFGLLNVERRALTLKTLGDAFLIRNHVIDMLERASIERAPLRQKLLSFIVVGGGFSGTELAASLNDFLREAARDYLNIDSREIKVYLLEMSPRLIPEFDAEIGGFAHSRLEQRGVRVYLNTRVLDAGPAEAQTNRGAINACTMIWAAGVTPSPLLATLPCLRDDHGRIITNEYMAVPGWPRVWAAGDSAHIPDPYTGEAYPPTAQHAVREGIALAANIAASIEGEALRAFHYKMRGQMVSLGRRSGGARVYRFNISGFPAWALWRAYYLWRMPGLMRKLQVGVNWMIDLLFPPEIVQLSISRPPVLLAGREIEATSYDMIRDEQLYAR